MTPRRWAANGLLLLFVATPFVVDGIRATGVIVRR
jgi:hypothetical protein